MDTDIRNRPGLLTGIARWSIRHPWWAVGLWLVFVATAVVLGGSVGTRQAEVSDFRTGESGRADEIIEAGEFAGPAADNVLITPHGAGWDEAAAQAAASEVVDRLGRLPEVAEVGEPVPSPVTDALLIPVQLNRDGMDAVQDVVAVLDELAVLAPDHPQLRFEAVGDYSITHGINEVVNEDLASAGLLSVPVTLVVLLIVFGALVAAGVPLLLSFSAVAAATGLWAFASQVVPDIGTVPQVILLIGLAVGVDYSLFYLKREREERARGAGTVDAVWLAAATSGRAVVVSGLTSMVALAGLYLAGDAIFAALATGVILAVAVAMLGSLTVLPALLVKLGRAVDWPRLPLLWRRTRPVGPGPKERSDAGLRVWTALLAPALRAPRTTLVVTVIGLVALALPALGMNLKASSEADLPRTIPVMQAYDRLVAAFPSEGHVHQVAVQAPAAQAEPVAAALADLAARAQASPLFVSDDQPPARISADGTGRNPTVLAVLELAIPFSDSAPEAVESLTILRDELLPATVGTVPGAEYAVGGFIASSVDYTSQQRQRMPWVIGFVVLLTVGMMALAFRSIVVALVAGGLTLLSVAAAFGLLTLVFQNTFAEGLLNFTSTGHVTDWVPLFLFVVLFGLSMDYHVFVVSRIREAAVTGMAMREAVRVGIVRSAGVVISAAAVMVAVFSIFATLSLIEMKQLGVGLAAAIAIDAVVVRILIVPAVMTLLGRANWWPSRLSRPSPPAPAADPAGVLPATVPPPGVQTAVVGRD